MEAEIAAGMGPTWSDDEAQRLAREAIMPPRPEQQVALKA